MSIKRFQKPDGWRFAHFQSLQGGAIRYGYASARDNNHDPNIQKFGSKGTVVLTGGYGRHIEYYYEKINNWLNMGYDVYAMDWYGQGGSSRENPMMPEKPATTGFNRHVKDFHQFVTDIVKPAKNKPAFLSSHSMGGNIMLRYMHDHEDDPDFAFTGAVLGTPLVDINTHILSRKNFEKTLKHLEKRGYGNMPLASVGKIFEDFANLLTGTPAQDNTNQLREKFHEQNKKGTKHLEIGYPTVGWLRAAMKSADKVSQQDFLEKIQTPVIILTAQKDPLVCVKAQARAANTLPNGSQITYKDARHGIWYDHDHIQKPVWDHVNSFVKKVEILFSSHLSWQQVSRRLGLG